MKNNKIKILAEEAEYIPHGIDTFNENPLIESIRPAMKIEEFTQKIQITLQIDPLVTDMDDFDRELMIELMPTAFIPSPATYKLYRHIVKAIMVGYLHRKPFTREYNEMQDRVATDKNYEFPDDTNLSTVITNIGISGGGKTKSIDKCLALLPQVISHNEYEGQLFRKEQVVYLKFEAPATRTKKGLILNFFFALDQAVGSSYYEYWKNSNANNSVFIIEAKKAATRYNIGIVFIDEIQRCLDETNDGKTENRATLNFIDAFFNSISIPMIIAGTYAAYPLFQTTMSTSRRLSSGVVLECKGIPEFTKNPVTRKSIENPYWKVFVNAYFKPNLLRKQFTLSDECGTALHFYSCGVPALFIRLIKLCYEAAIYSELEAITPELIRDVYHEQFFLIAPALEYLRKGEYGGFEDLIRPHMDLLTPAKAGEDMSMIDEVESKCIEQQLSTPPGINDDGLVVEMPAAKSSVISADDFRNLRGLNREEIADRLKELKND